MADSLTKKMAKDPNFLVFDFHPMNRALDGPIVGPFTRRHRKRRR